MQANVECCEHPANVSLCDHFLIISVLTVSDIHPQPSIFHQWVCHALQGVALAKDLPDGGWALSRARTACGCGTRSH